MPTAAPRSMPAEETGRSPATAPARDDALEIPPLGRRARGRRFAVFALALAIGGGAWWALGREEAPRELYRAATVERRDIVRVVDAAGTVDVERRIAVPAPAAGRLVEIRAEPGDRVTAGQVLARLDGRDAALAVAAAEAEVRTAEARVAERRAALEAAARDRRRADRLLARELISRQERDAARAEAAQAQAALKAAQGALAAARERLEQARLGGDRTEIRAPVDGVVLVAPRVVGAAVAPGPEPLFVLGSSLDEVRVDARVGEADIGVVRAGQTAEFTVLAHPRRRFRARVVHVGLEPIREGALVQYDVRLVAENPDGALRPGMTASVHMRVAEAEDVLAVPEAALRFVPPGAEPAPPRSRVFVRRGPRDWEPVAVEPGLSDGAYTAVEPADPDALRPGTPVAVGLLRAQDGGGGDARPGLSLGAPR